MYAIMPERASSKAMSYIFSTNELQDCFWWIIFIISLKVNAIVFERFAHLCSSATARYHLPVIRTVKQALDVRSLSSSSLAVDLPVNLPMTLKGDWKDVITKKS